MALSAKAADVFAAEVLAAEAGADKVVAAEAGAAIDGEF